MFILILYILILNVYQLQLMGTQHLLDNCMINGGTTMLANGAT